LASSAEPEEKNEEIEVDVKDENNPIENESNLFKKPLKKRGRKKQSLQTRKS
jgi:hypothetical protein